MKTQETKRKEAEERNAAWAAMPAKEQLRILKRRPGKSAKQIAKVEERIEKEKAEQPKPKRKVKAAK